MSARRLPALLATGLALLLGPGLAPARRKRQRLTTA